MTLLGIAAGWPSHAQAAVGTKVKEFDREIREMVRDPSKPRIYATTTVNTLLVINTDTFQIQKEIAIGSNPFGLDISPDGTRLYVANAGSTTAGIAVVDLDTLTLSRTMATSSLTFDVAAGLDGRLYLLGSEITQVDSATGALQATLSGYGGLSNGAVFVYGGMLVISPDRKTLYYGDTGLSPAKLYRFGVSGTAPSVLQISSHTGIGSNGQDLILKADGSALCYAVGSGNSGYDIALIPANDINARIGSFATGPYPCNGAFSPDGDTFYTIPSTVMGTVMQVYNTKTFVQTGSFPVSQEMHRLLCDASGRYLFTAGAGKLSVYSLFDPVFPVITSATAVEAHQDEEFSFTLTTDQTGVTWSATGLPAGVSLNAQTGVISGIPSAAGKFTVSIAALGRDGTKSGKLSINVLTPLTVTVSGAGTVPENFLGTTWREVGEPLQIEASPALNHLFSHWSGSISSSANLLKVSMQPKMVLQAHFVPSTSITIKVNGPGVTTPSPSGGLIRPVGSAVTVTAKPQLGARFLGWTGSLQSQAPTFTFTVPEEPVTLTANFEAMGPYTGSYQLLGEAISLAGGASSMRMTLGNSGWFTAVLTFGNERFSFGGSFLSPQGFDTVLFRKGSRRGVFVHLELKTINGVPTITGTMDAGDGLRPLTGYRLERFSKTSPAPQNGKYTFLLPLSGEGDLPLAWGYGSAQVSKSGAVVFKGVLGDGTPFTASGGLADGGYVRIQKSLYGKKGLLEGWVQFAAQGQSDFTGDLNWMRPARPGAKSYAGGFAIGQPLTGSRIAAAGEEVLSFVNGAVTLSGGGLTADSTTNVTIQPGSRVVALAPDTHMLRVSLNRGTGAFTGNFRVPGASTQARRTFRGVVDQKSQIAAGQFTGGSGRGSVLLREEVAVTTEESAPF